MRNENRKFLFVMTSKRERAYYLTCLNLVERARAHAHRSNSLSNVAMSLLLLSICARAYETCARACPCVSVRVCVNSSVHWLLSLPSSERSFYFLLFISLYNLKANTQNSEAKVNLCLFVQNQLRFERPRKFSHRRHQQQQQQLLTKIFEIDVRVGASILISFKLNDVD